ncbi:MAG TPA: redoxin domain-containing protein [Campylobacterales bacterium]|nr:redoxin domain-containing protein [Campylobacterales bacterium]
MSTTKRKWTVKRVLKEILITLALLLIISTLLNFVRQPDVTEDIYRYHLRDISNEQIEFFDYKDEPLIVHFWGTWCPICRFEASTIDKLAENYNVITIAVNSGSDEALQQYIQENNLEYRVINDRKGALAQKFDIDVYPTTLIYNGEGELSFSEVGYITSVGLEARLALIK